VWEVKVSPIGQSQSPLLSLAMYSSDGQLQHDWWLQGPSIYSRGSGGSDAIGLGYGRWAVTGDREFRLTYYSYCGRRPGKRIPASPGHVGLGRIRRRVHGTRQLEFLDANWNVGVQHHQ